MRDPFFNSKYGYDILRNIVAARYTYTLTLIFGEAIVFQRPQDVEIKVAPFEMKLAILSDFDGTVTLNDTFENVLEKFAQGDWRAVDDQYVKGEITLEECLRRQGAMVRTSKSKILDELNEFTKFRPGFDNLIDYCKTNRYPLVLVSAGLDFVIKHFLEELEALRTLLRTGDQATMVSDFKEMVVSLKREMLERDKWQGDSE